MMAKLIYDSKTGTYSIKPDSWTNGGLKVDRENGGTVHVPSAYVVHEGSIKECKDFIRITKGF